MSPWTRIEPPDAGSSIAHGIAQLFLVIAVLCICAIPTPPNNESAEILKWTAVFVVAGCGGLITVFWD